MYVTSHLHSMAFKFRNMLKAYSGRHSGYLDHFILYAEQTKPNPPVDIPG